LNYFANLLLQGVTARQQNNAAGPSHIQIQSSQSVQRPQSMMNNFSTNFGASRSTGFGDHAQLQKSYAAADFESTIEKGGNILYQPYIKKFIKNSRLFS